MKYLVLVLVLSLSGFSAFAAEDKCANENTFKEINLKDLEKVSANKEATILDVNDKKSFDQARVTNAVHYFLNKENFAIVLPEKKDAMIVAYCGGPGCGAWKDAAAEACKMGYTNVWHFKGGISGWKKAQKTNKKKS